VNRQSVLVAFGTLVVALATTAGSIRTGVKASGTDVSQNRQTTTPPPAAAGTCLPARTLFFDRQIETISQALQQLGFAFQSGGSSPRCGRCASCGRRIYFAVWS
jgi:hypothetical protein